MIAEPTLIEIHQLLQSHQMNEEIVDVRRLSGTTDGLVLRLESAQGNKYILKYDQPDQIRQVERLLTAYRSSPLLSKVLFTAPDKSHMLYTFLEGTTFSGRGLKKDWLTVLVKELFNKYAEAQEADALGRFYNPLRSWQEFHTISIDYARINIGDSLADEDFDFVQSLVKNRFGDSNDKGLGGRYLLHGDAGAHNFVYHESRLIGVIDPDPMVGPLVYDLVYAFCSTPDDLTFDTLFAAYEHLEQGRVDRQSLIDEATIQLYCRVGLSKKHHPNDLPEYLKAWNSWREGC